MAGDRAAALILQAAGSGVIDFSKADLLSRNWWLRLSILLDEVERQNRIRIDILRHARHVGAVTHLAGKEIFKYHWDAAGEHEDLVFSELFPWIRRKKTSKQAMARDIKKQWKEAFGIDPDSEEFEQKVARYKEAAASNKKREAEKAQAREERLKQRQGRRTKYGL